MAAGLRLQAVLRGGVRRDRVGERSNELPNTRPYIDTSLRLGVTETAGSLGLRGGRLRGVSGIRMSAPLQLTVDFYS